MLNDQVVQNYRSMDDFFYRLQEVEDKTQWVNIPLADLFVGETDQQITNADIDTKLFGTKWWAGRNTDSTFIPIRDCALHSLYDRIGLGGAILNRLSRESMEELVRFGIEHPTQDVLQLPVVEGKINAFLSSKYTRLPAVKVFEELIGFLQNTFNQENFKFNGRWTYFETTGVFELPLEKEVNGKTYTTVLVCQTSDAGFSSVNFRAYLKDGETSLPIMSDMSLMHKGMLDENRMLEGAIDKGVKKLNHLLTIEINNPKGTMKRVAKACNLPKKDTLELIEKFNPPHYCTAFDLFDQLSKLLQNNYEWSVKERVSGDVYKMLNINWEHYDLAGDYAW